MVRRLENENNTLNEVTRLQNVGYNDNNNEADINKLNEIIKRLENENNTLNEVTRLQNQGHNNQGNNNDNENNDNEDKNKKLNDVIRNLNNENKNLDFENKIISEKLNKATDELYRINDIYRLQVENDPNFIHEINYENYIPEYDLNILQSQ
jgi:exonuclease VII small subunit